MLVKPSNAYFQLIKLKWCVQGHTGDSVLGKPGEENQSHTTAGTVIFKLLIGLGPCPVLQILKVLKTFRVHHWTERESVRKANDPGTDY